MYALASSGDNMYAQRLVHEHRISRYETFGGDGENRTRVEKGTPHTSTVCSSILVFFMIKNEQKAMKK